VCLAVVAYHSSAFEILRVGATFNPHLFFHMSNRGPVVVLLLVFLMMFLGLFALFLGGGLVAQGYLYQQPVERLPLRAGAGAVLVSGFVTFWVWIDRNAPGKYDTFFNFTAYSTAEFSEFDAVRWGGAGGKLTLDAAGKPTETIVKFKRATAKGGQFLEGGTGAAFQMTGSASTGGQYMTGAILVKGPDDAEPVRYNAKLTEEKTYTPDRRFEEVKGSRYVEANQIGTLFVPSTKTVALALLLNFLLLVVWIVALWPIMRFSLGHALMFSIVLAIATMLALMPVLFKQNRSSPPPASGTAPAARVRVLETHSS
jgi:hypothetical protein